MSDGTINFPRRQVAPDTPASGRVKIWVDELDGKPKYTDDNGLTSPFGGLYGQNFASSLNESDTTNNTTDFEVYSSLNYTVSTVATLALYEVSINFVWGYGATNSNFRGRVMVNGTQIGEEFRQEPKDQGDDQRHYASFTYPVFGSQLGTQTGIIDFEYASTSIGTDARVYYCYMTIKRAS